ncbi:hypothetical protein [Aestuariivirga sp.]|uniref:hypothetical protein n=1 Tax=Aestuariivirga sp. TaxID=2650926 RepID=UPI003919CF52
MNRADFWCRVLGWLQIGGALAVGASIYALWTIIFGWIVIEDGGFFTFIKWIVILIFAFPPFLAGLLTLFFADRVEQARHGMREDSHVILRVFTALAGLWSAGVIGFVGVSLPPISFFAVLGLLSTVIAIMGHDWTADLFGPAERSA